MKKYWIVLSVAVAVVVAIAVYHYTVATPSAGDQAVTAPAQPTATPTSEPSEQSRQGQFNYGYPLQDTSMLKPPPGAKVAIIEFEDMECPACAHAFPIVHAAAGHYKIPLVRHDYPWQFHVWSFDAAVTARYIQDKLSPQLADDFRRDIFANQTLIASKDDLTRFTTRWFQSHGKTLPFVMDANGACRNEVESDRALGDRLGVKSTPCIIVVTQTNWVPIMDPRDLDQVVDSALIQAGGQSGAAPSVPLGTERPAAALRPAPASS